MSFVIGNMNVEKKVSVNFFIIVLKKTCVKDQNII